MPDKNKVISILQEQGKVLNDDLHRIEGSDHVGEKLVELGIITVEDLNGAYATLFGMEFCKDISGFKISPETLKKVSYSFVKKHNIILLREHKKNLTVAVADPLHLEALDELRLITDCDVHAVYCPKNIVIAAIDDLYRKEAGAASRFIDDMKKQVEAEGLDGDIDIYDLLEDEEQAPIIKLLNLILSEAIQQGASDIHFDPIEDGLKVRYRIDGVLQDRRAPAPEYQSQLLARIKVMAKLDIAERRLPQDGRIKLRMGGREIDFRVSTVPVVNGERIVLRILDKGNVMLGLENLGIDSDTLEELRKIIALPEGIVLVTGPTGSGKTTTLYSILCEVSSNEINIMTIEDPVEYKIQGIAQIAVRSKIKLNFATGLRHILRQDPDIIMVGEIRDRETAEIAIQASLTGHLVMSTLHTNDAPSAMTRLVDMGIETYLLSSTVVGVLAQRLVRKVCPGCCRAYKPSEQELSDLGLDIKDVPGGKFFRGDGCRNCYGSGYKGRHGIYELMIVDHAVKEQLLKSADAGDMRKVALNRGMKGLRWHGAQLVCQGITTVAEILRVTRGVQSEV